MKRLCLIALLCLMAGVAAQAQIQVDLEFDQETFLPNEPLPAKVRILNASGQTLILGRHRSWLTFTIEAKDGSIVRILKNPEVLGEFALPSAHRATKAVDLSKAFELLRPGRYDVRATVAINQWGGQEFGSKTEYFDIITGLKLWQTAFGVPSAKDGEPPEIRRYFLTQASHVKDLHLYLRITDQAGQYTFDLFSLGPMISFSKPEAQLDQWSNLHVLYQNGARSFLYHQITPDGLILERQTWVYSDTRPELGRGENGKVQVTGGVRRVSGTDLPPPELLSGTAPARLTESPAGTLADGKTSGK